MSRTAVRASLISRRFQSNANSEGSANIEIIPM